MHYLDYNEKKQHGTNEFPLEYYFIDENHSRYRMPFHWHREMEFVHILRGKLHLYLDDREYLASEGDLFHIAGGVIHGGEPKNCVYECVVFDPSPLLMNTHAARSYIRKIELRQFLVQEYYTGEHDPGIFTYANTLFSSAREKAPGWELATMGALFSIYGTIFDQSYYEPVTSDYVDHGRMSTLKPVLEYIDSHYKDEVTLEMLAHVCGMSSKYFCRVFKAVIHRTPIDYLNYYRIERASFLMETEDISVSEAAYQCGFNDSSYFVHVFKRYKNTTPSEYLKRINGKEIPGLQTK